MISILQHNLDEVSGIDLLEGKYRMKYKVEFQYKEPNARRPEDVVQDEPIKLEGEFVPIPDVGDSVNYLYGGEERDFKVVTRHFSYLKNWCVVNIVVTDLSVEESDARLTM